MTKAAQVINPQMILILIMMMLGLHLPEVKMQRVCWIYDKEFSLQQRIGVEKKPKLAPQYKSSSESDSDNDDVGAQPPRGKNGKSLLNQWQRIVPTVQNLCGKTPRVPPQYKYHSVFQTFPRHLLAKDLDFLIANRGDHKFFLLPPLQSNSSIHIEFQGRIMEQAQGHQYCIFLKFWRQHWWRWSFCPVNVWKQYWRLQLPKCPVS